VQNLPDSQRRRAALVGVKLAALAREHAGADVGEVTGFGGGAGVIAANGRAWVLVDERPGRGVGAALAWALSRDATSVAILADSATGQLARRAEGIDFPIRVFHVEERTLIEAVREPLPERTPVSPEHLAFRSMIAEGDAEPVVEHGVLAGEVRGLEVCRVVDDPVSGEVRLEVGIGAHDRETFQMLHGDRPKVEALAGVVRTVSAQRTPGRPPHPLNQLAASRLLRSRLVEHPGLIGATSVEIAEPPLARSNVKDQAPSVATATLTDGTHALVVCTTGIDLDVVPYSVDAVSFHGASSCLIAAPARDLVPVQLKMAALCRVPTRFVPVDTRDV
jgi:hypothetical protein